MRAVLGVIDELVGAAPPSLVRVFAAEAVTEVALRLRGRFARFLGSEYGADEPARRELYPIPHEDLTALTLPSDRFDLVTTNEVLEHVPDLDAALGELARVLKPGGWHVGTHPFRFTSEAGDRRSVLVDGAPVHLKAPEYHGNPVDPEAGSLVFETPGWDIIERAGRAGLTAHMRFIASERHGILTENIGVFLLCAQKTANAVRRASASCLPPKENHVDATPPEVGSYEAKLQQQIEQFRDIEEMHALPPAFHLWSGAYVGPHLAKVFGTGDVNLFYVQAFVAAARRGSGEPAFLSLGCGDGTMEIRIAETLIEQGVTSFRFVCTDLSDVLLERFRAALPPALADRFELVAGDLNTHRLGGRFDAIMANHSLHHMVDLEGVFRTAYDSLGEHGIFVTADMIGRNGHMRWPEAKLFVDFFWPFLSLRQRRNGLLSRTEEQFINHDCSTEGFEGVRAQDVLPAILAQGFHPARFLACGGMIDVFVDRCFGPNFDVAAPDDAFLCRRIAWLNEVLLDAGLITPTMMFAYFVKHPTEEICLRNRSAAASVRNAVVEPTRLADALADFAACTSAPDYAFRVPSPPIASAPALSPPIASAPAQSAPIASAPPATTPAATTPAATTPAASGLDAATAAAKLAQLEAALQQAQAEAAAARQQATTQAGRVAALEASSSWQVTAPLRLLTRKLRR